MFICLFLFEGHGWVLVGQNMRDIFLNLELGYKKHFMVEYCSRDVPDHESK